MSSLKVTFQYPPPDAKRAPAKGVQVSLAVKPTDPSQAPIFSPITLLPVGVLEFDQTEIDGGDQIVRCQILDSLTSANDGPFVDTPFTVPFSPQGSVVNVVVTVA